MASAVPFFFWRRGG